MSEDSGVIINEIGVNDISSNTDSSTNITSTKGHVYLLPDKHSRIKFTDDNERCSFIIRGKEQCKNKRTTGSSVCLRHDATTLEKERQISSLPKGSRGSMSSLDRRISASQERMFNPLATPLLDAGVIGLPTTSWNEIFSDPSLPTHIDIGSARGKLLFDLFENNSGHNFIGLEVRGSLVEEAEQKRIFKQNSNNNIMNNLKFLCANVMSESHCNLLYTSFQTLPLITRVSILFPDPWIKQKHKPRRVIQLPVLLFIANILAPGGELVIVTDVEDIVLEARSKISECTQYFKEKQPTTEYPVDENGYFLYNPFMPYASEREEVCELLWRHVYRLVYIKNV